jgi:hypothetical protein
MQLSPTRRSVLLQDGAVAALATITIVAPSGTSRGRKHNECEAYDTRAHILRAVNGVASMRNLIQVDA